MEMSSAKMIDIMQIDFCILVFTILQATANMECIAISLTTSADKSFDLNPKNKHVRNFTMKIFAQQERIVNSPMI